MHITLLTMGKTDVSWVAEGLKMYASRLVHYVPFSINEIPSLKGTGSLSADQLKTREAAVLLKAVKPSDTVILLDEHGEEYTSVGFADRLQRWLSAGKNLVFVIGGAFGFAPEVYARADGKLSLSKMTASHQLVRTIFAEQLYRAFTILKGEPYHNE
ncbi:MAG: 23S rRNA (pseudouridine(1915)-N(3))-methyltransferase RlmH [Bacteroidales bacterium]|nr:23S rRNA (pseudouridine(1915)-N(3))-methyltransferase RlmH [Bacteroidales bacterium]